MSILEVWLYFVELIGIHLPLDCADSTSVWSQLGKCRILGLSLGACWFWTDSEQLYFTDRVLLEFSWLRAKKKWVVGMWCVLCAHLSVFVGWAQEVEGRTNLLRGKTVGACKVFSGDWVVSWTQEILVFGWTIERRRKRQTTLSMAGVSRGCFSYPPCPESPPVPQLSSTALTELEWKVCVLGKLTCQTSLLNFLPNHHFLNHKEFHGLFEIHKE